MFKNVHKLLGNSYVSLKNIIVYAYTWILCLYVCLSFFPSLTLIVYRPKMSFWNFPVRVITTTRQEYKYSLSANRPVCVMTSRYNYFITRVSCAVRLARIKSRRKKNCAPCKSRKRWWPLLLFTTLYYSILLSHAKAHYSHTRTLYLRSLLHNARVPPIYCARCIWCEKMSWLNCTINTAFSSKLNRIY